MTAVSFFFFCSAWRRLQVFSRAWNQSDVVHLFKSSTANVFSPRQFTAFDKFFHFKFNWNTYLVEHTTVSVKTCPLTEHQTTLQNIAWKRRLPRTKHGYMWSSSTQTSIAKKKKNSKNPGWTDYNHSSRGYERLTRHIRVVKSALDPIGLKPLDTLEVYTTLYSLLLLHGT